MNPIFLLKIPFLLQALLIFFDEFFFHQKRVVPRWEIIGHPLDTLTVIACMLWVIFAPYNSLNLAIFISLGIFSTLFITKDEWVHKDVCPKAEMWLHALLFINHPVLLFCMLELWALGYSTAHLKFFENIASDKSAIFVFLKLQAFACIVFFLYQIIYYRLFYEKKLKAGQ